MFLVGHEVAPALWKPMHDFLDAMKLMATRSNQWRECFAGAAAEIRSVAGLLQEPQSLPAEVRAGLLEAGERLAADLLGAADGMDAAASEMRRAANLMWAQSAAATGDTEESHGV